MKNQECISCQSTNQNEDFVFETNFWKIFLVQNQSYLGRCVVISKRHCEELSELKQEEWLDFADVVNKLEKALEKTFGATMFNWTCMMNDSYKSENPNPHVHWHFRPRYNHKVEFAGLIFEDSEFGHHYDRKRTQEVSDKIRKEIIQKIRNILISQTI